MTNGVWRCSSGGEERREVWSVAHLQRPDYERRVEGVNYEMDGGMPSYECSSRCGFGECDQEG